MSETLLTMERSTRGDRPYNEKEKIILLRATLEGIRGMAVLEAHNGSNAWRNALHQIDLTLEETK